MRPDTPFHIASITKTITATATLRLVDQGKLSLDVTLPQVLDAAVVRHIAHADAITVRELIDHSSGIYATNNDMEYLTTVIGPHADPSYLWTPEALVALADPARVAPVDTPGAGHHYSDTNYVLLSIVVARASGRPFKQFVTDEIFRPLGMTSTYYYSDRLPPTSTSAVPTTRGYIIATPDIRAAVAINAIFPLVPGQERNGSPLIDTTLAAERIDGAGGIVSTLPDLAKFARAFFDARLLTPSSQALMTAVGDALSDVPIGHRRVWALRGIRKSFGTLLFAEGDGPGGVNTIMAFDPASRRIYLGFVNVFGSFDEVDWMMDNVIGPLARAG